MIDLAVVIPVMRRTSLEVTVRHYLRAAEKAPLTIYVADFDPSFSTPLLAESLRTAVVRHIPVQGRKFFNKAKAINCGAAHVREANLVICDADVCISPDTLARWAGILKEEPKSVLYLQEVHETSSAETRAGPGIVGISKRNFEGVQGYCSEFEGWGFEDWDFLRRCERAGLAVIADGSGCHQTHDDALRVENYRQKNRCRSRERNRALLLQRDDMRIVYGTLAQDVDRLNG
jgi:hypothetical protein